MRRQRGQITLELLIVIMLWMVICALFLSGMLLIGSLMLTQAGTNRTVQQIATLGCVPNHVRNGDIYLAGIGVGNIDSVQVQQRRADVPGWSSVPDCSSAGSNDSPDQVADPSSSGTLIKATINYQQQIFFVGSREVSRSATAVSGRLEKG